jgi:hypothetical protein
VVSLVFKNSAAVGAAANTIGLFVLLATNAVVTWYLTWIVWGWKKDMQARSTPVPQSRHANVQTIVRRLFWLSVRLTVCAILDIAFIGNNIDRVYDFFLFFKDFVFHTASMEHGPLQHKPTLPQLSGQPFWHLWL